MATRGATQVTAGVIGLPIPIGGYHLEVWRLQGGTAGDTAAVTPARGRYVITAVAADSATTIGTNGTDTNVTFTYTNSQASTSVTFDAWLLIAE